MAATYYHRGQQSSHVGVIPPSPAINNVMMQVAPGNAWHTPLCCPEADCSLCMASVFCPCCVVGANVRMLEENVHAGPCDAMNGPCTIHGGLTILSAVLQAVLAGVGLPGGGWLHFAPCYSCQFRKQLREKYNIHNGAGTECVYHYFCQPCALCQEHVELHKRLNAGNVHMQHGQPGVMVMMGHMNAQAGPTTTMAQPVMGQPVTTMGQRPGQPPYQIQQATVTMTQPPPAASM